MTNERLKADAAMLMDALNDQLAGIAEMQKKRMQLIGTASVCDKRIHVTVNATGVLIDTRFADDIGDLTFDEIAAAMTEAVQAAAADVERKGQELREPLLDRKARLPKLSELVEGVPELGTPAPLTPPAAAAPDGSVDNARPRSVVAEPDW
ncbi:YbaB/EbfC family nucleoid-associated protein [Nocardia sp. NPDC049149]|uniref:YbaB/EbfC family nucleoid-associated protein n=1 Tax=Nocardia sp. NPDC049149 TaxID=3364315 RepID=UPI00371B48B2